MRTVRAGVQGVLRAFPGRFVAQAGKSIAARKTASKRLQRQKKTPGNDIVSIIISRCLSIEFIADT